MFINPNFHVILVHLPLGVFLLGVLLELLTVVNRRSTLRLAGRWMILLGALATIPVAFTGIYAFNDIAGRSQPDGRLPDTAAWAQVASQARLCDGSAAGATQSQLVFNAPSPSATAEAWGYFRRHAWVEGSASALVALTAVLFLGLCDRMRHRLYFPALALLLGGAGLMCWGAWSAGQSIYGLGSATRLLESVPHGPASEPPAVTPTVATSSAAPSATAPAADATFAMDPLPQLPSFHLQPSIVVSPTSEPTTEPTTSPTTEPTTSPTTEPTTSPATEPATTAPTTVPAPETTPAPTPSTAPAPETTPSTAPVPETTPATAPVVPPPTVPPAGIFPPLAPSTTQPSTLPSSAAAEVPAGLSASREPKLPKPAQVGTLAYYIGPPLQVHVLLAGFSVAIALGALGASMRRLSTLPSAPGALTPDEAALEAEQTESALAENNASGLRPVTGQDLDLARSINPGLTVSAGNPPCVPAARLWLAAFLGVLLTAAVGIYFLATMGVTAPAPTGLGGDNSALNTRVLWGAVIDPAQNPEGPGTRRLAHVIGGAALLLLPLLLAIFARWSRSKLALALTSLLLVAVVAGQVWIGILLLYDSRLGKINHFRPAPVATPARVTSPV